MRLDSPSGKCREDEEDINPLLLLLLPEKFNRQYPFSL
jgi:hypothetical protein